MQKVRGDRGDRGPSLLIGQKCMPRSSESSRPCCENLKPKTAPTPWKLRRIEGATAPLPLITKSQRRERIEVVLQKKTKNKTEIKVFSLSFTAIMVCEVEFSLLQIAIQRLSWLQHICTTSSHMPKAGINHPSTKSVLWTTPIQAFMDTGGQ